MDLVLSEETWTPPRKNERGPRKRKSGQQFRAVGWQRTLIYFSLAGDLLLFSPDFLVWLELLSSTRGRVHSRASLGPLTYRPVETGKSVEKKMKKIQEAWSGENTRISRLFVGFLRMVSRGESLTYTSYSLGPSEVVFRGFWRGLAWLHFSHSNLQI